MADDEDSDNDDTMGAISMCDICKEEKPSYNCYQEKQCDPDQRRFRVHDPRICALSNQTFDLTREITDRRRHHVDAVRERFAYNKSATYPVPGTWMKKEHIWKSQEWVNQVDSHVIQKAPVVCSDVTTLMQHQTIVKSAFRPHSPISRLLVIHPTGSGKTLSMVEVADNFFFSPTATIMVVTNEQILYKTYQTIESKMGTSKLGLYLKSIVPDVIALMPRKSKGTLFLDTYQGAVLQTKWKKSKPTFFKAALTNDKNPSSPIIIIRYRDLRSVLQGTSTILNPIFRPDGDLKKKHLSGTRTV